MAEETIVIGAKPEEPRYVNGKIVNIHEQNIYDVRLANGQVEAYVENISNTSYNSGEYVVLLIIGPNETKSCKIIGRGRKMTNYRSIEERRV